MPRARCSAGAYETYGPGLRHGRDGGVLAPKCSPQARNFDIIGQGPVGGPHSAEGSIISLHRWKAPGFNP